MSHLRLFYNMPYSVILELQKATENQAGQSEAEHDRAGEMADMPVYRTDGAQAGIQ